VGVRALIVIVTGLVVFSEGSTDGLIGPIVKHVAVGASHAVAVVMTGYIDFETGALG